MMSENRMPNSGRKKAGKVFLVGAGPGGIGDMTLRAVTAIRECEVLCGYTVYIGLILDQMPQAVGKRILTTPMRQEMERCRAALEEASLGRSVAMICSGDAGVYGRPCPGTSERIPGCGDGDHSRRDRCRFGGSRSRRAADE